MTPPRCSVKWPYMFEEMVPRDSLGRISMRESAGDAAAARPE
jgi:hypothetical protein